MNRASAAGKCFSLLKKIRRRLFFLISRSNVFQIGYVLFVVTLLSLWLSNNKSIDKLSVNITSIYPATGNSKTATLEASENADIYTNFDQDFLNYLRHKEFLFSELIFESIISNCNKYPKILQHKFCDEYTILTGRKITGHLINPTDSNYQPLPCFICLRI